MMNIVLDKPICLHIPPLHEDAAATLFWAGVSGADGYELECVLDESFSSADKGKTWCELNGQGESWLEINDAGTWQEFADQAAKGASWCNAACADLSWSDIKDAEYDQTQLHELPTKYTVYKGPGIITDGPEENGTWENMHASCLAWSEIHEDLTSWNDLKQELTDNTPHISHKVRIPLHKKKASYRIRAFAEDGSTSDYITSTVLPITPIFVRADRLRLNVVEGGEYLLQLHVRNVERFSDVVVTFDYSPYYLQVSEYPAHPHYGIHLGLAQGALLKSICKKHGRIKFKIADKSCGDARLNGFILILRIKALHTGSTAVKLY